MFRQEHPVICGS